MRRLRSAAASKSPNSPDNLSAGIMEGNIVPGHSDINILPQESSTDILVDINFLYQTILVNLKEPDPKDPLHKIINRSSSWDVSSYDIFFIYIFSFIPDSLLHTLIRFTIDKGRVILTHGSAYHQANQLRTHGKNQRNLKSSLFVLAQGNGTRHILAKTTKALLVQLKEGRRGQFSPFILLRMKSKVTLERQKQ